MKFSVTLSLCFILHRQFCDAKGGSCSHQHEIVTERFRFWTQDDSNPIDISEARYIGLNTFAGVPNVDCFSKEDTPEARYDIAILGAPLDTVSFPTSLAAMCLT